MSLIKPGHTSLNMEDIAEDLSIVHRHVTKLDVGKRKDGSIEKPVLQEYFKDIQKADDTDLVAGIDAKQIAVAISQDNRTTIDNAIHFNSHDWDEVMTKTEGGDLRDRTNVAIVNYRNDIKDIRDEVYQLRAELAKSGALVGYKPYAGFYDLFRNHQPMHEAEAIATATADSVDQYTIKVEDVLFDRFSVGDKVLVKSMINGNTALVGISEKKPDGMTLKFNRATGFNISKGKCMLYKTKGNVINGTFTFGEITPERPGKKEFYSCLDDDTFRTTRPITANHTGFGCTFRIPESLQKNYLSKMDIQVKRYGNPGALTCYIIDERDIPRWKNAAQAAADNDKSSEDYGMTKFNFFAKSQPLIVDAALGEHHASFTFYDSTAGDFVPVRREDMTATEFSALTPDEQAALAANGTILKRNESSYPLLNEVDDRNHRIRYCAIIEALSADVNNYYTVVFLQNKNENGTFGDLQLNNKTFEYREKENESTEEALKTDTIVNSADLYYGITLIEAVHEAFTPYDDGVYSARFTLHDPITVNSGRLMLRIAREGMYTVDANGSSTIGDMGDGGVVAARGKTNDDVNGFSSSKGNQVVIGTEIRKVASVTGEKIALEKGLHVEANAPVYPIGYKVAVNARLKQWNPVNWKTEIKDVARYELPLATIMPDQYKANDTISDRLIFESDFLGATGEFRQFNDFEIQITWEKTCKDMNYNFAGRIYDLAFSLNRSSK